MTELTARSSEDLQKDIAEKREALRLFRFGGSGSRARNVREGRNVRRYIARMLTELRARVLSSSKKEKIASAPKKM